MRARIGLVGAGWWAQFVHLPALAANPDAEVVAICDRSPERAGQAAQRFEVPRWVTSVGDLRDIGIDAAIVATPHDSHYGPAAALLDAGIDVMVEKPMTIAPSEAWDLVRRAATSRVSLHVGYTFPHSQLARSLRSAMDDLGDVVMVSSLLASAVDRMYRGDFAGQRDEGALVQPQAGTYGDLKRGGGQLYTQLTHAIGLVLWLTDVRPMSVAAHAAAADADVDLSDTLTIACRGGALASFATTGMVIDGSQRVEEYRFFAHDGHALLDTMAARLEIVRRDAERAVETGHGTDLSAVPSAALVATTLGRAPVAVSGELGARVVEVLDAARRSATTSTVVSIPEEHHV